MAWVRLDDNWDEHPKMVAAGLEGRALWLAGLTHACKMLTDGHIATAMLPLLAVKAGVDLDRSNSIADLLVDLGSWDQTDNGWSIHDFADWQPSREHVEEVRAARAEAGRRGGRSSAATRRPQPPTAPAQSPTPDLEPTPTDPKQTRSKMLGVCFGVAEAKPNPVPSRPVPTHTHTVSETLTSSVSPGGPGGTDDDRPPSPPPKRRAGPTPDATWQALAQRRLAAGLADGTIRANTRAAQRRWLATTRTNLAAELAAELHQTLAEHPNWTPNQLAEHLDQLDHQPLATITQLPTTHPAERPWCPSCHTLTGTTHHPTRDCARPLIPTGDAS